MLVVKTCLDCSILPDIHVLQLRNMKNFQLVLYFAYFIGVLAVNAFGKTFPSILFNIKEASCYANIFFFFNKS